MLDTRRGPWHAQGVRSHCPLRISLRQKHGDKRAKARQPARRGLDRFPKRPSRAATPAGHPKGRLRRARRCWGEQG
eukprot:13605704-Alexandrium_andersonii.AAC.1